ncbi:hypothetical protein B0H63DRAFT_89130 [Podospora didyma]|uniref:Kinesin light chain n=1 Tax=Podospora didyma TaxID=330526 RepID=A0AAE0K1V4_9PEZI|nr:hypothetical protein B0H63DRAFT_89130 [Podospora didyma]
MDVYSLGMLCLWLLFHARVSGSAVLPVPPVGTFDETLLGYAELPWSWRHSVGQWKESDNMGCLTAALFYAFSTNNHGEEDTRVASHISECLAAMLAMSPEKREQTVERLLKLLREDKNITTQYSDGMQSGMDIASSDTHHDFDVAPILPSLTDVSGRVRRGVYSSLLAQAAGSSCVQCQQNAAYQVALCISIGFGSKPNAQLAEEWLKKSNQTQEQLRSDVGQIIHTKESRGHHNEGISDLWNAGALLLMDLSSRRDTLGGQDAEEEWRNCVEEIQHATEGLGSHDHAFVFALKNELLLHFMQLGRLDEAYTLATDQAKYLENIATEDDVKYCAQRNGLAAIEYLRGNYEAAVNIQRVMLEDLITLCGEEDLPTLLGMADLSLFLYKLGDLDEVHSLLLRALNGIQSTLGNDHPSTLGIENDMASVFYQRGDLKRAEDMFRDVLARKKTYFGIVNQSTLATMGNLAVVTRHRGDFCEAEQLNRQALQIRCEILPPGHLDILANQGNLAAVLQQRGKLVEAQQFATQCRASTKKALGPCHPDTLTSMHNLASILQDRQKFDEALDLYKLSLKGKQDHPSLGPTHDLTLDTASNLGLLYTTMKQFDEARIILQTVLDARRAVMMEHDRRQQQGKQPHRAYLAALKDLGIMYELQGEYEKADNLLGQAYRQAPGVYEEGSLEHLAVMYAYASICNCVGGRKRLDEALDLYGRVLDGREAKLGPGHGLVNDAAKAISRVLEGWGDRLEDVHSDTLRKLHVAKTAGGVAIGSRQLEVEGGIGTTAASGGSITLGREDGHGQTSTIATTAATATAPRGNNKRRRADDSP